MKYSWLVLVAFMAGCEGVTPIRTVNSGNVQVGAAVVAQIDGRYRLYRVNVGGDRVYFVTREGEPIDTAVNWTEQMPCGDGCWTTVDYRLQTLTAVTKEGR